VSSLPAGWVEAELGQVVEVWDHLREPIKASDRAERNGVFPYYGANGQAGTIDDYKFDGDFVLLAEDGGYFDDSSRGVAYIASGKFWVNNHAHVLKPRWNMPVSFWMRLLNSIDWMPYVSGTTRLKLTQGAMNRVRVPVPPLNEQRRIVAKLETLLARSRRAKDALGAIPELLERFRQSVLAAAFRGDLTRDWREQNSNREPISDTVEEELWGSRRQTGKHPYDLPQSWAWAAAEEIAEIASGLTKNASLRGKATAKAPLVSVAAVKLRQIEPAAIGTIGLVPEDGEKGLLRENDVLLVEGNGSLSHIGRVALWNLQIEGARHQNHIIRLRPHAVEPEFLVEWLASPAGRAAIIAEATSAAGLYTLSLSKVGRLPIPVPPEPERLVLMERLRAALKPLAAVTESVTRGLEELPMLERALLDRAFRGELLLQDPNDEPASVFLERIRAERERREHLELSSRRKQRQIRVA